MKSLKYKVMVDDNFHFMDKSERYASGMFDTYEQAVTYCKEIIDEFLVSAIEPGITADQLFASYEMYGEDPFIVGGTENSFNALEYTRTRCSELTQNQSSVSKPFLLKPEAGETAEQFKTRLASLADKPDNTSNENK